MKFYECYYEDYIQSSKQLNYHPELTSVIETISNNIHNGVGKYTQSLKIIYPFSQSKLKYDKKIKIQTDKYEFICRISDIHYEIDMSLLGCNPKTIWHEIFMQVVDIISVKQSKMGIILCKNFHMIHTELLEIFYSYIQQYSHSFSNIQMRFIMLTEHISFIPNNILNCCKILSVKRPSIHHYIATAFLPLSNTNINTNISNDTDPQNHIPTKPSIDENDKTNVPDPSQTDINQHFITRISNTKRIQIDYNHLMDIINNVESENITNTKEIRSFSLLKDNDEIPPDIFNIICDNIIHELENPENIVFTHFRDTIYDILIYNLDVAECFWTIFIHFIKKEVLDRQSISDIIHKTFLFLKYYNNNYRPIYHLESIFFYIIIKLQKYNEL
jgi:hypothetical protein